MVREVDNPNWFGKLFFDLRLKSTLGLFFVLFLSLGLLVTIQQLMTAQNQDIRQQAAGQNSPRVIQEDFVGGTYEFIVESDNVEIVSLDEHVIYNNIKKDGSTSKQFNTEVSSGTHTITILYTTSSDNSSPQVTWKKL